jgi:hypothetical protein
VNEAFTCHGATMFAPLRPFARVLNSAESKNISPIDLISRLESCATSALAAANEPATLSAGCEAQESTLFIVCHFSTKCALQFV